MALRVCSASARRALRSLISASRSPGFSIALLGMVYGTQIQPEQNATIVTHVADEFTERQRQTLYERGSGDDLLRPGQKGLLIDVDHFEGVTAFQMLFANSFDVGDGAGGFRGGASHIEPQAIFLAGGHAQRLSPFPGLGSNKFGLHAIFLSDLRRSKPAMKRSGLE